MRDRSHLLAQICVLAFALTTAAVPARADTIWLWSYAGNGVAASGNFTTTDTPDGLGFYQIVSITGSRNGDTITGLSPTGFAIPGNEPFIIDNLIRVGGPGQVTVEGFGYSLASGAHANPYYADFLSPPTYSEVFTHDTLFSEVPVSFSASPVPEPTAIALIVSGLFGMAILRRLSARA